MTVYLVLIVLGSVSLVGGVYFFGFFGKNEYKPLLAFIFFLLGLLLLGSTIIVFFDAPREKLPGVPPCMSISISEGGY